MIRRTGFGIAGFLSVVIGLYPLLYFLNSHFRLLGLKDASLLHWLLWRAAFYMHIGFSGLALLIGWLQFSNRIRLKRPSVHRLVGRAYTLSALLGAAAGVFLSFYASGGWVPAAGFFTLGIVWLATTITGFTAIRNGNVQRHTRAMYYSYACCFAAVMLRIYLPLLLMSFPFKTGYALVAWICWVPNLVFVRLVLLRKQA